MPRGEFRFLRLVFLFSLSLSGHFSHSASLFYGVPFFFGFLACSILFFIRILIGRLFCLTSCWTGSFLSLPLFGSGLRLLGSVTRTHFCFSYRFFFFFICPDKLGYKLYHPLRALFERSFFNSS